MSEVLHLKVRCGKRTRVSDSHFMEGMPSRSFQPIFANTQVWNSSHFCTYHRLQCLKQGGAALVQLDRPYLGYDLIFEFLIHMPS